MTYFLCFFIYSFVGFIIEVIFTLFMTGKLRNRKTMKYLPLCPVYGVAGLSMTVIQKYIPHNLILYFILGFIVCSITEYFYNWTAKKVYNISIWDYSGLKLNINGNICLVFSLIWGILSILFFNICDEFFILFQNFPLFISELLVLMFVTDSILTSSMLLSKKKNVKFQYCYVFKDVL